VRQDEEILRHPSAYSRAAESLLLFASILAGFVAAPAFAAHGDLDPAFADVGRLGPIRSLQGSAWSVIALEDGAILLAGGAFTVDCGSYPYCEPLDRPTGYHVARFLSRVSPAGNVDSSLAAALPEDFAVRDMARQPDGKLVVVGRTAAVDTSTDPIRPESRLTVLRLLATGQVDTSFGVGGLVELPITDATFDAEWTRDYGAMSVIVEPDGRIVVSGSDSRLIVLRLLPDGSFDETFGESGVFVGAQDEIAAGLQILRMSNGRYRVLIDECRILGLTRAGGRDQTFGSSGIAAADPRMSSRNACHAIAAFGDNRLLVAGGTTPRDLFARRSGFVVRLLADGQLDPDFAADAVMDSTTVATALAVGDDDSIYVSGIGDSASIMRMQASGEIDPQFGDAGRTIVDLSPVFSRRPVPRFRDMIVRPDGGVVAAGVDVAEPWVPGYAFALRLLGRDGGGSPGVLAFTRGLFETSERDTEVVVNVRRTGGDSGNVSVAFQTTIYSDPDRAAIPGQDFDEDSGHLSWDVGDRTSRHIRIRIRADRIPELSEYFGVRLSDLAGGAGLGAPNALVYIWPDGAPHGLLDFSSNETSVLEEGGSVTLAVHRNDYSSGSVSVTLVSTAGSATAADDFGSDPITVFWEDGDGAPKNVTIPIVNDSLQESAETFRVALSNPTGGAMLGERSSITITIRASDQPTPPPPPPPANGGGGAAEPGLFLLLACLFVTRSSRARLLVDLVSQLEKIAAAQQPVGGNIRVGGCDVEIGRIFIGQIGNSRPHRDARAEAVSRFDVVIQHWIDATDKRFEEDVELRPRFDEFRVAADVFRRITGHPCPGAPINVSQCAPFRPRAGIEASCIGLNLAAG
jgi:uncharacterized delta-60 repeat protein